MSLEIVACLLRILFIFICLSYLIKPGNKVYNLAEALFIGGWAGHTIVPVIYTIKDIIIASLNVGKYVIIIPLMLGALVFARFTPKRWLSRYATSFLTAVGLGLMFVGTVKAQFLVQIDLTIRTFLTSKGIIQILSGIILIIGCITSISYFIYTREHEGLLGILAKIGRNFLMIAVGCYWAGHLKGDTETVIMSFLRSIGDLLVLIGLR